MTSCGLVAFGLQKQVLVPLTLGQHMSGYILDTRCARLRRGNQTVALCVIPDVAWAIYIDTKGSTFRSRFAPVFSVEGAITKLEAPSYPEMFYLPNYKAARSRRH
jgi:hypothetical protein